jgi:hypothetical protein
MLRSRRVNYGIGMMAWLLLGMASCYAKIYEINQQPRQRIGDIEMVPINVGLEKSKLWLSGSVANAGNPNLTGYLAEILADQLNKHRVFALAVYPYTPVAGPAPVIFRTEEKLLVNDNDAANIIKSGMIGASFFLLNPVLFLRWEETMQATVTAVTPEGKVLKEYQASATYRLDFTLLGSDKKQLERFRFSPHHQVAQDLLKQIADDHDFYATLAGGFTSKSNPSEEGLTK